MRLLALTLAGCALLALVGCGGTEGSSNPPTNSSPLGGAQTVRVPGPGMPVAEPDDFEITDDGKIASALYHKFYADAVNHHSAGRWIPYNYGGYKEWTLSNTYNSAPKAWTVGGNYWNNEADSLLSTEFTIPDNTDGVRLTFMARWKAQAGDYGIVYWQTDGSSQPVVQFTNGQNPDYPGWTKYYYELPANLSGNDTANRVEFWFESNNSGTDWGFGVDNVAVYQRQLEPPVSVSATDGTVFEAVDVTWSHNNAGTLVPDGYHIYEGTASGGPYTLLWSEPYPATTTSVLQAPGDNTTYYYVIKAYKNGWPDSAYSNEDSGFAGI